jgi:predicted GNAT family acetyltransferase
MSSRRSDRRGANPVQIAGRGVALHGLSPPSLRMDLNIEHDTATRRFQVFVDGHRCELDYELSGTRMSIVRTGVPEAVGGRGIAARLTDAAVAAARERGWTISPLCSYARVWFQRHPEHADLLDHAA